MSYPTRPRTRSRTSSAADKYTPDDYAPVGQLQAPQAPQMVAPQAGGYLAPGPAGPIPMPEPNAGYQPSPLSYGSTPPAAPVVAAPRGFSYQNGQPPSTGSVQPPYPTEYPPRPVDPRRLSHSSQYSARSNRSHRSSHSHHPEDDYGREMQHRRSSHGSHGHRDHHHHHRHHDDYDLDKSGHRHHDGGTKPLKRTDDHRPTLGDTVVAMFNGFKSYISK